MRRRGWLLPTSVMLVAACSDLRDREQLRTVAERFFAAAAAGDTVAVKAMAVDTIVLQDLRVIANTDPTLMTAAGDGLELERGGFVRPDSAYLYFQVRKKPTHGLGVGFVRPGAQWRIFYAGLTGSDVKGPTRRR